MPSARCINFQLPASSFCSGEIQDGPEVTQLHHGRGYCDPDRWDTKGTALECPVIGFLQPREKESRGGSKRSAGMKVWNCGMCLWKQDCSSRRDSGEWKSNARAEMEAEH